MVLDDFARYVIATRQMDPLVERKPDSKESGIESLRFWLVAYFGCASHAARCAFADWWHLNPWYFKCVENKHYLISSNATDLLSIISALCKEERLLECKYCTCLIRKEKAG